MSKKVLVVIDPGHYPNYNRGAVGGYFEGDKMYDLSVYEKEALESYGIDVIITRGRSNDMGLYNRGQVAVKNGKNYDEVVFMSNHSNAFNGKACGVVAYRSLYLPDSEKLGQKLIDAIVDVMKPITGVTYSRGVLTREGKSGDYYGVLRGSVSGATSESVATKGPVTYSLLVEHGFHDHVKECTFLNNNSNLKKMANAKAKVIAEYFGVNGVSKEDKVQVDKITTEIIYRVRKSWDDVKSQLGAYASLDNAKKKADENPGYYVFLDGASIYPKANTASKSVATIAKEVIAGKWGVGADRKKRLTEAGYDYKKVQAKVNELLS